MNKFQRYGLHAKVVLLFVLGWLSIGMSKLPQSASAVDCGSYCGLANTNEWVCAFVYEEYVCGWVPRYFSACVNQGGSQPWVGCEISGESCVYQSCC